jgi:hypothetical protein
MFISKLLLLGSFICFMTATEIETEEALFEYEEDDAYDLDVPYKNDYAHGRELRTRGRTYSRRPRTTPRVTRRRPAPRPRRSGTNRRAPARRAPVRRYVAPVRRYVAPVRTYVAVTRYVAPVYVAPVYVAPAYVAPRRVRRSTYTRTTVTKRNYGQSCTMGSSCMSAYCGYSSSYGSRICRTRPTGYVQSYSSYDPSLAKGKPMGLVVPIILIVISLCLIFSLHYCKYGRWKKGCC